MKLLLTLLAVLTVSVSVQSASVLELETRADEKFPIALQGWRDTLKEAKDKMKTYGKDLVCSESLQGLMDLFGVPDELDGLIGMAQDWFCDDDKLEKREVTSGNDIDGMMDTIKKVWAKFAAWSKPFVCSSDLDTLMDLLGVPDELDGLVDLAQDWYCKEATAAMELETRADDKFPIALQGWRDTLKAAKEKMKKYGKDLVCSESLQGLMDLFDVPDALDGLIGMAQDWFCDDDKLEKREVTSGNDIDGMMDTIKKVWAKFAAWSKPFVCSSDLDTLMDLLGVPDELDGLVDLAQDWYCKEAEATLEKRAPAILMSGAMERQLQAGFRATMREMMTSLKTLAKEFACSAKVHELMDLLKVPDALDGVVELAQKWLCGDDLKGALMNPSPQALQGFRTTVKEIYEKLKHYGAIAVCDLKLVHILAMLFMSPAMGPPVTIAVEWLCTLRFVEI